ncbi:hypothetical protein Cme02nite_58890 [Catellatospora methionotrophica]|uniref:Uncharacterized protein n=1 Tax=Catellatospora methionotrophica TaxID=121620 RepID=A0A8J3LE41_9ACTN|nr:hypothetical protein Cme02nite_58890 [Catellatospora methionotrophica]
MWIAIGRPALTGAPGMVSEGASSNGAAGAAVCAAADTTGSPATVGPGTAWAAGSGFPGHGRLSVSVADSRAKAVSSTAAILIANRVIPC